MKAWKQKEIARWILDRGIGTNITSSDIAVNIYGKDEEDEDRATKAKASQMLLNVYKNWKNLAGDETLLVRYISIGKNGFSHISYMLKANNEDSRAELTKGILTKAKTDALKSQGNRKTNFDVAENAKIEIIPDMDTLVLQARQVAISGSKEDKLRLVGAIAPVFMGFAGLPQVEEQPALDTTTRKRRGNKSQIALAGPIRAGNDD